LTPPSPLQPPPLGPLDPLLGAFSKLLAFSVMFFFTRSFFFPFFPCQGRVAYCWYSYSPFRNAESLTSYQAFSFFLNSGTPSPKKNDLLPRGVTHHLKLCWGLAFPQGSPLFLLYDMSSLSLLFPPVSLDTGRVEAWQAVFGPLLPLLCSFSRRLATLTG